MRSLLLCCLLVAALAFVKAEEPQEFDYTKMMEELENPDFDANFPQSASFLETESGEGALATYLPDSGPYDNPSTDVAPIATIPETPTCTIRGQTIFEIRKMRQDAKQIGMAIMYEIQIMEKRKTYIEQMTSYLNDRIRELNKVKQDLKAEQTWIQVSNQRITELAQKEKLIKLQDVMSCIQQQQQRLNGEAGSKTSVLASLKRQSDTVNGQITSIRNSISRLTSATSSTGSSSSGSSGGGNAGGGNAGGGNTGGGNTGGGTGGP